MNIPTETSVMNTKSNFTRSTFLKGNNYMNTAHTNNASSKISNNAKKNVNDKYIISLEELKNCYLSLFMPFLVR